MDQFYFFNKLKRTMRFFRLKTEELVLSLTALVILFLTICLEKSPIPRGFSDRGGLNSYLWSYIDSISGLVDTTYQRRAYGACVALIFILGIGGGYFKKIRVKNEDCSFSGRFNLIRWIKTVAGLSLFVKLIRAMYFHDYRPFYFFCSIIGFIFITQWLYFNKKIFFVTRIIVGGIFLFYCLYLLSAGLWLPPNITWVDFFSFEGHWSSLIGPTLRLVQGRQWFEGIPPSYGLFNATLFAWVQRCTFNFNLGDYIHGINFLQITFAVLAAISFFLWKSKEITLTILPLFFAMPRLATNSGTVFYPNHSPWRLLGFAIAPPIILLTKKLKLSTVAWIFGFVAGILVLINLETGICLSFGLIFYIIFRSEELGIKSIINLAIKFGLGFCLSLFLFFLTSSMGNYGSLASFFSISQYFRFLKILGTQVGGQAFNFSWPVVILFGHTVYVVIKGITKRVMAPLSFRMSFQTSIGIIILLWLSYYANRSSSEYLWSHFYLYGFLITDLIKGRFLRFLSRRPFFLLLDPGLLVLACFLLPFAYGENEPYLRSLNHISRIVHDIKVSAGTENSEKISGVHMSRDLAKDISQKAAYLRKVHEEGVKFSFFSPHPFLMPLFAGIDNHLFVLDTFNQVTSQEYYFQMIKDIATKKPDHIFFELLDGELNRRLTPPQLKNYYEQVQKDISQLSYHFVKSQSGWDIWAYQALLRSDKVFMGK